MKRADLGPEESAFAPAQVMRSDRETGKDYWSPSLEPGKNARLLGLCHTTFYNATKLVNIFDQC
ncbi:hypothetical protein KSX_65800 [Ktedonospora formicarum]|uniref:Uncharacterized protein n=1 Tax=Ktedonospora formicarum TaxID=2778364 RepID=A0A8J3MTP0_9CHLR|nr:hypothetical protein KSX_65800 [Ktedonospora formicarum]